MGAEEAFEKVFASLVTVQTVLFCIGISILVMVIRRIVEKLFPNAKNVKLWEEVLVPLGPYGTGALFAIFTKDLVTSPPMNSWALRLFYGLACGAASDLVYAKFKRWIGLMTTPVPPAPAPAPEEPPAPPPDNKP